MEPHIHHGAICAIKADTRRLYGRFGWTLLARGILTQRPFRPIVTLRLCQGLQNLPWPFGAILLAATRLLHRLTCQLAGMDLPWTAAIRPGLAMTHGWGIVVSPGVRIGSNVTLFHGVTLGRRDRIAEDGSRATGYPTIEDEVWIGPHAIVVGAVTVGRGSRIAAGTYVYQDIPPASVVAGNPATIIKSGCMPDVPNKWETPDR